MRSPSNMVCFAIGLIPLVISGCANNMELPDLLAPTYPKQDQPVSDGRSSASALLAASRQRVDRFRGAEVFGSGDFVSSADTYRVAMTPKGDEGIALNLVDVPVQQAAKTILGDILKLNYAVSDKVTGKVTIQTTTPVAKAGLIDAFESVLKLNGAAIIQSDGWYRVMPQASAANLGVPVAPTGARGGIGTKAFVVPLEHVGALEMKKILAPIAHKGAVLRADASRNLLVISGTKRELEDIRSLIGVFDVSWMSGMSVALYPVKTSDPESITRELETIFGLDKDGPLKGVVRFVPNRRLGSVLVISSKPDHLDKAKEWIYRLDKAAAQGESEFYVYKIQNRSASELADLLQKVLSADKSDKVAEVQADVAPRFEPETSSSAPSLLNSANDRLLSGVSASAQSLGNPSPAITENFSGAQDEARDVSVRQKNAKSFQISNTKVVADVPNNSLLIEATPKDYERILRILERLDVLPTQVMLEAVIAEVSLTNDLRFGLKWFFEKNKSQYTFTDSVAGIVGQTFPGFSYFFSATNMRIALDALSSITDVNVISAPSLMVMDGKVATLQIGDQVPIVTQTARSVTDPGAPIVNAVELKDTGVILTVSPRVNDSGRVVMQVAQEVSNVTKTTTSGIDSPTIQQRKIETTVVVNDGEVVALGGLIQQRDGVTKTQVPILGDLPVVGTAFRNKEDTIDKTELIIFIRPQVMRDVNEARQVTDEFRSRIDLRPMMRTRGRPYRRDAVRILR